MTKKILFILMPEEFQDFEFEVPFSILQAEGHSVDIAGLRPGDAKGTYGLTYSPNLLLAKMSLSDFDAYDALVIPGGPGSSTFLWENKEVQNAARYFHDKKKIVATICHACVVPAQAGLLTDKEATVYPSPEALAIFEQAKVKVVDQGCVILKDERIITAQGPKFAKDFAESIAELLEQ